MYRNSNFHEAVEWFWAERGDKNSIFIPLFIPGRIVHLVDISCDKNHEHYVPYWYWNRNVATSTARSYQEQEDVCWPWQHALARILRDLNLDRAHMASLAIVLPIYGDADDMDARERNIYNFLHLTQILMRKSGLIGVTLIVLKVWIT